MKFINTGSNPALTCQYLLLKIARSGIEWKRGQKVALQQPL